MFYPSFSLGKSFENEYSVLPISMELMADIKTPMEILKNLKEESSDFFMLESVVGKDNWSRYTFLGYKPDMYISGVDNKIKILKNRTEEVIENEDPKKIIREILAKHKSPKLDNMPPFTGGLVGYFAYDFVKYGDPKPNLQCDNPYGFDDFNLMLINKVICIDHFRQKIILISNIYTDDFENNYTKGIADLKDLETIIIKNMEHKKEQSVLGEFKNHFSKEEFCEKVDIIKNHIYEGDIFQAVFANRFMADFEGSLLNTYRMLRTTNPSPYMVYMNIKDIEITCASPETLVSLRENKLNVFPLAGTRPRCDDEVENMRREKDLLSDEKELSEHDMLVDLARNDLGKISKFGSVQVEKYHKVQHYTHVMHIASMVTGQIKEEYDCIDALIAALPAGTLSGAPKKRAMEIIDTLENTKRGVYGGAIGYIDFTGNCDFCIGIRMAFKKDNRVFVGAGAGIVFESDPTSEYEETIHKGKGIMNALKLGGDL